MQPKRIKVIYLITFCATHINIVREFAIFVIIILSCISLTFNFLINISCFINSDIYL
jgi:hypothetical protein